MNRSTILSAVIGLSLIAGLVLLAAREQREMVRELPPKVVCASFEEAYVKAGIGRIEVLGTGSMAPYIPAAPKGKDPLTTVCAIVKPSSKPFTAISKGDLVVYQPSWAKRYVIHQAAKKQDDKWIMSGLHNRESEWFEPIGQDKFVCIIETVYVWNP